MRPAKVPLSRNHEYCDDTEGPGAKWLQAINIGQKQTQGGGGPNLHHPSSSSETGPRTELRAKQRRNGLASRCLSPARGKGATEGTCPEDGAAFLGWRICHVSFDGVSAGSDFDGPGTLYHRQLLPNLCRS